MATIGSYTLWGALLIGSAAVGGRSVQALAPDTPAIKLLLSRAQAQAEGGHLDIAVSTWKQVLASDPRNLEALRSLAAAEVRLGHQAQADVYIQRLQKAGGSAAAVGQLQSLHAGPSDAELLRQATALAKAGQYSGAMAIYRKLYGNNPPVGDTALIYYDTLAALPGERKRAVEGLRKLALQLQADERYSIALGRVLTYDASTRQEGMALLRRYPADRNADDALRQAMVWSEGNREPSVASTTPAATAVPGPAVASTSELGMGFRALNAGSLAAADEHFRAAAREATHGQAHAGLGYVRMRQQDFAAAVKEFEQAKDEGDRDLGVTQALMNSRFYRGMAEAQTAVEAKNMSGGIEAYRSALALKPNNADALTALGGTLLGAGHSKEAEPYLQRAVKEDAGSKTAWRALFLAQSQDGKQAEAIQTAEHLPTSLRGQLNNDPDFLGSLAADYAALGDQVQSDRILKRALALSQDDAGAEPSVAKQLQYAALLLTAKRYTTAARSYRRVLTAEPDNLGAWRGVLTADHLAGHDAEALREFRLMPAMVASAAQKEAGFLSMMAGVYQSQGQIAAAREMLERALRIAPSATLQLQLAALEMSDGDQQYATELYAGLVDEHPQSTAAWLGLIQSLHATAHDRDALRQIDEMPEDVLTDLSTNPDYWQSAAAVFTSLGNSRRTLDAIAQVEVIYQRRGTAPPAGVELQQGWLLLQAKENVRLSRLIQQLSRADDLTPDQQTQLARLWGSWTAQRAALLTRQGHRDAAATVLAAGLRAFPNDTALNNALADAYVADGQPKRAVALYARQDIAQADAGICVAAISVALTAGDRKQAQVWLQSSLSRFNRNPKVLELAARFEQQRGDPQRAAAYYRAALEASGPPSIVELTATSATAVQRGVADSSPRQELFDLLTNPGTGSQGETRSATGSYAVQDEGPKARQTVRSDRELDPETHVGNEQVDDRRLSSRSLRTYSRGGEDEDLSSIDGSAARSDAARMLPHFRAKSLRSTQAQSAEDAAPRVLAESSYGMDTRSAESPVPPASDRKSPRARRLTASDRAETPYSETLGSDPTSELLPSRPTPLATYDEPSYAATRNHALIQAVSRRSSEEIPTSDALTSIAMLGTLPAEPVQPLPPLAGPVAVVRAALSPRQQVQQDLANIESSSSPYLGGDSSVGFHSGQPGFDQLTIFSADVEQSSMIGMGGRITVVTHPTLLQGGTALPTASYQLGTLALGAVPTIQTAAGVGGEVQLRTRSFGAAVGSTPRGFLVQNITGRLLIQPNNGPVTFSFERQANEETQLSYAGARDPGSATASFGGNIWGGVISNAASLLVKGGDGTSGWYVQGGGQYITGKHVLTNNRIDGYAGAYWALWNDDRYGKLTLGMNFFGMHYAHNQRLYTYGNGGYFSPGAYLLSSVPVSFEGHSGTRLRYRASGAVGLQAFQEDASPYFPLDPDLQSAAKNPFTADRTSVGANYNLDGEASYLLTEHWHAGVSASFNNSYDYHNERVGFFVRYALHPQSLDLSGGPTGLTGSNHGLRPLLLP